MNDQDKTAVPPWRKEPPKVHVVLPAYNEEADLPGLLERIDQAMADEGTRYEVIVVDDGSKDRTAAIAEEHAKYMPVIVHRHPVNQGLGGTIREGLRIAADRCDDRDIVIAMDADNTHTPGLMRSMTRLVEEGNDVVIASRYQRGAYVRGVPWHREMLSLCARLLFQIVFPIHGVRDYTCGYRAYRGRVLKEAFAKYGDLFVSEGGFQCMVDILLKLRKMDVIIREIPLILRYDLKGGASKMNVMNTVWRTLWLMMRRRIGL
ncbi:MAG: glycosyltransferase family 2 protein [Chitinispirillaceae bacterium]|nr:glycosyltransferase family 2 protein [Chitinispirillaceae bacterium]